MIQEIKSQDLEALIRNTNEQEYLIVDIRKPEEFELDHIPGSVNIPANDIAARAGAVFNDRRIIFCCRTGCRSKVAVLFAMDAGYDEKKLFNLHGGMMAYTGEILLDLPRIDLFYPGQSSAEVMKLAIDLEKGAFLFYSMVKDMFKETPIFSVMEKMERAERGHAGQIYHRLKDLDPDIPSFDAVFDACSGRILEGGKSFSEFQAFICGKTSNDGEDILDFAIELEFTAYDLYRTMAENGKEAALKDVFFALAQAEKKHLELIIEAAGWCDPVS